MAQETDENEINENEELVAVARKVAILTTTL